MIDEARHSDALALRDVLAAVEDTLVVTDGDGRILHASRAAHELLGGGAAIPTARPLADFVAVGRSALETALAADGPGELQLRLRGRDGERDYAVALRPGAGCLVWTFRPVPGQGRDGDAEERVLRRVRVVRLVEELAEAVLSVDRHLKVEFANRSARRLLAVDVGGPLPRRWEDFDLAAFATSLLAQEALHAEALVRTPDGRSFTLIGMPTEGRDDVVLLFADTSARDRREQAQRDFVANAAHELRTPITGIAGAVEVLQAGAKDDPAARDRFLGHIARESHRLVRLVNSLLVLATSSDGTGVVVTPLLVRPLLEDVAARLRPRPGVRVDVRCPPELEALADRDLVERALDNVAENAAKFTRAGGILLSGHGDECGTVLEVADSGPGIPTAVRARVFERFYRGVRHGEDGFGLGLSIALQAVDAVGGSFALDEGPRGGTVARIVLQAPVTAP